MAKKSICLDIGGTKILGVLFENSTILDRIKKKTKNESNEKLEDKIILMVEEIMKKNNLKKDDITAISVGSSGIIDEEKGIIIYSPNLPWRNYNLKNEIEKKFNIPFLIGNDVNMGILGEWKYGVAKGFKNALGIFVGTGIGGGLVLDNKLYTGASHSAGEIGHMTLNSEGPYCNCGQRGCLEAYSSKTAMFKEINSQISRGRDSVLKTSIENNVLKSKVLKKAIEEKDSLALEVLERASYHLAVSTGNLINIFNPEIIVFGGGVITSLSQYIMPIIEKNVSRFAMKELRENVKIKVSSLADNAGVYGSLALIEEKIK